MDAARRWASYRTAGDVASDDSPQPLRCSLTREHWWGAPTPLIGGSAQPICVLSGFGSKLPLPFYADVRFHIPMNHNHDRPEDLPRPELVVCSPLKRAILTALLGFPASTIATTAPASHASPSSAPSAVPWVCHHGLTELGGRIPENKPRPLYRGYQLLRS